MKGFLTYPVLLILLFAIPAYADFQKGLDATQSGNFATAMEEWKPSAEKGHAGAQTNLGFMYAQGNGVTQNNTRAYMLWNIAASQGIKEAAVNLSMVQRKMAPTEIKKAKQLASDCVAKNYKGC